ncbi:amidase [Brevibacterium sp. HMSC07C04]|uniref:amidase n=1 Tax=Brevibacterium sp. HMSC07C04 TaxID=1581130 RepID=UPI0008A17AF2|nr:amidase [Brevibacterium sp. HMSC07C04]OFS26504.1 glutamyl-tRNA amidotransferase [Brevibacterium sp. HMSC07C04]
MPTDQLHWLSVRELLCGFRAGAFTPMEVLDHLVERIEELDKATGINAIVDLQIDSARELALAATRRYQEGAGASSSVDSSHRDAEPPLLGVPFLIKEQHDVAGLSATRGSQALQGRVAEKDAEIVERLKQAGAIPFGRTTTPEMSCATFTHTREWGVTRNPYNPNKTPGGSSGGSGAAVAAGFAPFATASDIGGSTRIPAAFCGLPGLKTSYGRTPGAVPTNIDWYRGDHILARTVSDTALVFNQIMGPSRFDMATLPVSGTFPVEYGFGRHNYASGQDVSPAADKHEVDLSGWKIGVSADLGCYELDESTRLGVERIAETLEAAGARIVPVEVGLKLDDVTRASMAHYGGLLARNVMRQAGGDITVLEPYTQEFVRRTTRFAEETSLLEAAIVESDIQQKLLKALDDVDVFITATSAVEDLDAGEDFTTGIDRPDGEHNFYWEAHQVVPFNIANRMPAMSVPSGIGSAGVPTGVQIVGMPYREATVLQVAAAVEALMPFPRPTVG